MGKRVRKLTRRNKIMRKSLRRNSKVSRKNKISRKSKISRRNKSIKKRRVNRKTLRRYKLRGGVVGRVIIYDPTSEQYDYLNIIHAEGDTTYTLKNGEQVSNSDLSLYQILNEYNFSANESEQQQLENILSELNNNNMDSYRSGNIKFDIDNAKQYVNSVVSTMLASRYAADDPSKKKVVARQTVSNKYLQQQKGIEPQIQQLTKGNILSSRTYESDTPKYMALKAAERRAKVA